MEIGMIGLGRMGANMARRLLAGGHRVVVANRSPGPVEQLAAEGAVPAWSWSELVRALSTPRVVWLMVPAGDPTDAMVDQLADLLQPGDLLVDGGNSFYKDSLRHAQKLAAKGLHFVDVGTSGGIWGRTEGYSLMVGGDAQAVEKLRPALETLAPGPDRGWGHVGPVGSGHFVKMVHNGIEYGLMQAYAEGFEIMRAKEEFALDLHQIAEIWRFGSVVRSWLLDLAATALAEDPTLSGIEGWVADSGEGRWTVAEAIDCDVPAPVITLALLMRFVSRQDDSFAAKMLAALRNQFGGHAVRSA
ncbi:MAG: decarboxylating 6-phosphogluconate dehydrogenase [Thermoleophilia bacterium]